MINVLLCCYNNYYNRILKKLDSVTDYRTATYPYLIDLENINFNPADGVTTDLIVGKGTGSFLSWEQQGPNYCVVYEKTTVNNVTTETIKSRWFIMDEDRTRNGQYKISLRRDVLADNIENIKTKPIYVEKGYISDIDNPLLCNNEGLTVNQIKKDEILLKDKSQCPWLVMYLKKRVLGSSSPGSSGVVTINIPGEESVVYEELTTPITGWRFYDYADDASNNHTHTQNYDTADNIDITFRVCFNQKIGQCQQYKITSKSKTSSCGMNTWTANYPNLSKDAWWGDNAAAKAALDAQYKSHMSTLKTNYNTLLGYKSFAPINAYNGQIIKDSAGKYYEVTVTPGAVQTIGWYQLSASSDLRTSMTNYWNTAASQTASPNNNCFWATVQYQRITITLTEKTDLETSVNFASYDGPGTTDSPLFDAICMPYGTLTEFIGTEVSTEFTTSKERSLAIMNSLATQLSSDYVLDLQVLPYCPVRGVINDYYDEEGKIAVVDEVLDYYTLFCYSMLGNTDAILVCPSSNLEFDIEKEITISDSTSVPDTYKVKYVNDCTMLRVCSPNYNGLFEMNLAKNGMSIDRFNVDMTLKPFNPYIHVNPNFKGLYGQDFNDIRGLVCNGDFSLGIINDAWVQYEIQNKNYQAIFDRQIQNLDRNNAINKTEAMWQAGAGTLQGATTGATAGFMAGGGYGAAAGAVVGGLTAGAGGIMDIMNLEARQKEARSYAIDNYNLQLGNVRALPVSITKTSALTANNKLFPFVEVYKCTDEEKEAYYNKLRYDGMTIGKIDVLENYIQEGESNYFKGQLIRCDGDRVDNHILEEISRELMKGVYL